MSSDSVHEAAARVGARQPIDALIFDYGEVLCRPADPVRVARMADGAGLPLARFQELYWRFREDYDRGVLDGPDYWRHVGEAAGRSWTPVEVASIIEQDIELWTDLDERMLAWVEARLDEGVRMGMLSNMVRDIGARLRTTIGALSRFAAVTFSCEVGSVKPEPEIYHHVLGGVGVAADRALLVDDRQVNIDGARTVGMPGIVFRGYESFVAELDARFILTR